MASTDHIILSDEDKKTIVGKFLAEEATIKDALSEYPYIVVTFPHQATSIQYLLLCRRIPHDDRVSFETIDARINVVCVAKQ